MIKIGDPFWVDANDGPEWSMKVLVHEKDPDRALIARHRIYVPETAMLDDVQFDAVTVPKGSVEKPQERALSFTVPTTALEPDKCHRLELVVSGSFDSLDVAPRFFDFIRDRAQEHDIDSAGWHVWEGDRTLTEAGQILKSCDAEVLMQDVTPTATGDER